MSSEEARLARYHAQRNASMRAVEAAEQHGTRYFEAIGRLPLVDVTDQRVSHCRANVEAMDSLIKHIEAGGMLVN